MLMKFQFKHVLKLLLMNGASLFLYTFPQIVDKELDRNGRFLPQNSPNGILAGLIGL